MDLRSLCCALQLGTGTEQILLHGHQVRAQLQSVSEQICDPPNRSSQSSEKMKERQVAQNPERQPVTPSMQSRYSSARRRTSPRTMPPPALFHQVSA
jgi:hypothetical protein